jgi:hypothetical protein
VKSFPKSRNPRVEKDLKDFVQDQDGFKDKKVRKLSLTKPWGGFKAEVWTSDDESLPKWERDHKRFMRHSEVAVGVFDPQNDKCWSWPHVVIGQEKGTPYYFIDEYPDDDEVREIDCKLLK